MSDIEKKCDKVASTLPGKQPPGIRTRSEWLVLGLVASALMPAATSAWAGEAALLPSSTGLATAIYDSWLATQIRLFRSYPHLDRAYKLIAAKKYAEAARELKSYLDLVPGDQASRNAYLNVLFHLKSFDAVLTQAGILLGSDPGNTNALLFQAMALQEKGNARGAYDTYLLLAKSPSVDGATKVFAANTAADLALRGARYADALTALEALGETRGNYAYFTRRGAALAGLHRPQDAIRAYLGALETAQADTERRKALEALVYLERETGQLDQAIAHVDELLRLYPDNADWLREKAVMHYLQKDHAQALATIGKLRSESLAPKDHFFMANVLLEQRAFPQAVQEYKASLVAPSSKDMEYKVYMGLGYAYAGSNEMRQAQAAFAKALELEPAREATQALANVKQMLHAVSYHADNANVAKNRKHAEQNAGTAPAPTGPAPGNAARGLKAQRYTAPVADGASSIASDDTLTPDARQAAQQAYDLLAAGNDAAATAAFDRAFDAGASSEQLLLDAAFAHMRLKQWYKARDHFLQALRYSRSAKNIIYVARSYVTANQPELAIQYFNAAKSELARLPVHEQKAILLELGHLYSRQQDYASAVLVWTQAYGLAADAETLLNIAHAQEMSGQTDLALETLQQVRENEIEAPLKLRLYDQLARVHEKAEHGDVARNYMLRIAEMEPSAIRYYQVGLYELRHKDANAATEHIRKAFEMDPGNLTYAEQLAYLYKNQGAFSQAEEMFEYVIERDQARIPLYQDLAYTYKQHGKNEKAVAWFKRSIDARYAERREARLGKAPETASRRSPEPAGDHAASSSAAGAGFDVDDAVKQAVAAAREAVAPDEPQNGIALDTGTAAVDDEPAKVRAEAESFRYVSLHPEEAARDERAQHTVLLAQADAGGRQAATAPNAANGDIESIKEGQDQDIYRMRQEVSELTRRFQFNVYQSYRAKAQSESVAATTPGFFSSGAIPSQGGMEFIYQPPDIGYQDGRIFQVYSRLLWSNHPESLRISHETLQAAVGARYKPFKNHDMFASLERLIKVGDQSQSDWLARLSYAWTQGYELRPDQSSWNQTLFYGDLGHFFPNAGITALYSEVRQGRSFNYANRMTVTPHLMLAGRVQRPDPQSASYLEAGAGVAVKVRFNEDRYAAERSSLEFLMQYRRGFNHQHAGGWVFTAALQF